MGCCLSFCHARPDTFPRQDAPLPTAPPGLLMATTSSPLVSPTGNSLSRSSSSSSNSDRSARGKPLRRVACRWTSPVELSRASWQRRRREFWETAPSFGGNPAIWQALRMAIAVGGGPLDELDNFQTREDGDGGDLSAKSGKDFGAKNGKDGVEGALRLGDLSTAQTILQCAGVILPKGSLKEAYDERGYRYAIPIYCLADPINVAHSEELKPSKTTVPSDRLLIRLPDGTDLSIAGVQADWDLGRLREELHDEQGLFSLFWQGKGPLPDHTRLADLGWSDPDTRMQAWRIEKQQVREGEPSM